MKKTITPFAAIVQTPVFPQTLHTVRPNPKTTAKAEKKSVNTFSKSRDTREDRGTREMKTSQNTQSFPHVR